MEKFLIIQTAFIGDVVLSTALIEKIASHYPKATIDFLVRDGNQSLLENNPFINEVLIWKKKNRKYYHLFQLLKVIRRKKYNKVINVQRYFATGLLTAFSNAEERIGFNKNPLSFLFDKIIPHHTKSNEHEIERNQHLIEHFTDKINTLPKLYPSQRDYESVAPYLKSPFINIFPTSVWFTKQLPENTWVSFIDQLPKDYTIYLLGGKENIDACQKLQVKCKNKNVKTLAGKLSFLQSCALMEKATMNYSNDSAPLHFSSALNAPITAIYCSTAPLLGFTPLSKNAHIVESKEVLHCKPCNDHGKKACPKGHFKCGTTIQVLQLLETL